MIISYQLDIPHYFSTQPIEIDVSCVCPRTAQHTAHIYLYDPAPNRFIIDIGLQNLKTQNVPFFVAFLRHFFLQ